jgi:hypothetical protein
MRTATLDKLIWTLVFGGLIVVSVGLFIDPLQAVLRRVVLGAGGLATALGLGLIPVRARRQGDDPRR